MAIQIKNGQIVTSTATEVEVQPIGGANPGEIFFVCKTGTVQVTVGARGGTGVIGGDINGFVLADGINRMSVSIGSSGGTSIFIKGAGTIFFTW